MGGSGTNRRGDVVALLGFAALSGLWTWLSWGQTEVALSGDTQNILLMVLKQVHPDLFSRDGVFSTAERFSFYTPLARHYLAWTYQLSGDLTWGLRILIFPLNFGFQVGAYLFFRRLLGVRPLAAVLALFASLPVFVKLAEETYGIGPFRYMYPRTVFTAFLPWLLTGFLAWRDRPGRFIALGAATGVLANIHPASGFLLVQVMALTHILLERGALRAWGVAALAALASLPGVLPTLSAYLGQGVYVDYSAWGYERFYALVQDHFRHFFYPPSNLLGLPDGVIYGLTAAVAVLMALALARPLAWEGRLIRLTAVLGLAYMLYFDREMNFYLVFLTFAAVLLPAPPTRTREMLPAFFLIFAIYTVGVLGMFVLTIAAQFLQWQPDLNQARAVRFAPLLLFALVGDAGLALRDLKPAWQPKKAAGVLMLGLALFMTVRWNYRTLIVPRPDPALTALEEVAAWAREHTAPDALFLFDSLTFRLVARRAITGCYKDRGVTFASGRGFAHWLQHHEELSAAAGRPAELYHLGRARGVDFVVLTAAPPDNSLPTPVYRNARYQVIPVGPRP